MLMLPPPTSFFIFTRPRSGSMPVVSQSIIRPMVPVGASTLSLAVANAVLLAVAHGRLPRLLAGEHQLGRHGLGAVDRVARVAVHAQHVEHVRLVVGEAGERTHAAGRAGAGGVRVTGHQRRERRRPSPTLGRVVGQTERHQQRAEVGVAEAELAELAAGLTDRLGRVVGATDEDLLRREHRPRWCALYASTSKLPSSSRYFSRLIDARLHAELSRCMYSLAVAHDHAVGDVAVVARLAEVVRQLNAVVRARATSRVVVWSTL